jgi:5,5'-dehydrodivanillate O-demethylase oxygenase subunit
VLTAADNATLTQVGPGTPMGRLLRWYWHPIAAVTQLDENPVRRVKLLGESLVLYRDRKGQMGLVGESCAHRGVNLGFGIPEIEGLRCPYHGWMYDETGQCLEMPAEAKDSSFPSRVKLDAYPVQELAGLVFAYLGSQPAPLLPRWDLLVCDNVLRDVGIQVIPCNWLQIQENDLDAAHAPWLHGRFADYVLERLGRSDLNRTRGLAAGTVLTQATGRERLTDIHKWEPCDIGIMNYVRIDGELRASRPSIFPNMNSFLTLLMYRVPIDDTHTLHVTLSAYPQPEAVTVQQGRIPYYEIPDSVDSQLNPIWSELDTNGGEDVMAWVGQGAIAARDRERLGETDKGIILYRELLERQLRIVEDGGEPMNVFRDASQNACVDVPPRSGGPLIWPGASAGFMRRVNASWAYSPIVTEMVRKHRGEEALQRPVS